MGKTEHAADPDFYGDASPESLKAIPPSDPDTTVHLGRGKEGLEMARFLQTHPMGPKVVKLLQSQRGRPKKGEKTAEQRGLTLHAALREAVVQWLDRADHHAAEE